LKVLSKKMLSEYMITKRGLVVGTKPERLFDSFQKEQGLGLVWNVTLPFVTTDSEGARIRYYFQLDFARPIEPSGFDVDFEVDGKAFHSSDRQVRKDAWKDSVKNKQGLKVIHVPAVLCEHIWWPYLAREIARALISKEPTIYIEA
jgi:hypothetical protein